MFKNEENNIDKMWGYSQFEMVGSNERIKNVDFFRNKHLDGDLSYCFGIDYVYFKNSKHYNHRVEDFS